MGTRGIRGYANSGDWTWEHWPPPFDQWAPSDSVPQPAPILGGNGMGGCGCGCDQMGLGQTGLFGSGLFASSDPTTWGVGEYAAIGVGVWIVGSAISDVSTVGKKAKRTYRRASPGAKATGIGFTGFLVTAGLAFGAYYLYQKAQGGLGDYQAQGFVTPQILAAPVSSRSSALLVPVGF